MNLWEDEEDRGDERSAPLIVENASRSKRKSTFERSPLTHLSLDFRYTKRARYQHISNLVTCMRHFEATKDDEKLALVLATMLQAEVERWFFGWFTTPLLKLLLRE